MNLEAIPCIDCITYSICRALRNEYVDSVPGYLFIYKLTTKCSIIDKYLDKKVGHDVFKHRLHILEEFYGCEQTTTMC
jgi:hypothetical protein